LLETFHQTKAVLAFASLLELTVLGFLFFEFWARVSPYLQLKIPLQALFGTNSWYQKPGETCALQVLISYF
jgi:hypothetical protein